MNALKGSTHCSALLSLIAAMSLGATGNQTSPLGINLTANIDWASELVFLDYAKRARVWIANKEGMPYGEGGPLDLDEHGYIRSLEPGQKGELFFGTYPHYEEGAYYVFFDGEGAIEGACNGSGRVTESGQTISVNMGGCGYAGIAIKEVPHPDNYVRNIRIVHEDDLARYRAGHTFKEPFLQTWAPYRTLRFMDWGQTNNHPNGDWAQRAHVDDYTYGADKGVPIEVMVRLANEMNAYPWFCIPHKADDEYVRNFAQLVRDSLNPDLRIYLEHSNEVWNGIFSQCQYAVQRAQELGLRGAGSEFDGLVRYHAQRTAEIVEIWNDVLGQRERLIGVLGTGGPANFVADEGMRHLRSIGKQSYIDAIGLAPYVGSGKSFTTVDQAIGILYDELDGYASWVSTMSEIAESHGLRLVGYEGGQHLWAFGQGFTELGEQVQEDPRMRDWVLQYMNLWKENGGHEFMVFASGGDFWGQIPWGTAPTEAPKYMGHYEFITQNPIWWDEPQLRARPLVPTCHIVSPATAGAVYDIAGRLLISSPHRRTEAGGAVFVLRPTLTRRPAAGVYVAR